MTEYRNCCKNEEEEVSLPEEHDAVYPTFTYQNAAVALPVTVTPFACAGRIKTIPCGCPEVIVGKPCPKDCDEICTFTVKQVLSVEIPVIFGSKTEIGETCVKNLGTSKEPCGCKER